MKMKKFWMIVCMIAAFLFLFAGCGNQASADDEEDPTTMETAEKVTEFDKDQTSLTFADIENGINFKAAGTSVTFRFEDIDSFDNSLEMQFSLSDASYEKDPVVLSIEDGKEDYQFDNLEKGKEYYLEVYPTKSADSDSEYEEIQEGFSDEQMQQPEYNTGGSYSTTDTNTNTVQDSQVPIPQRPFEVSEPVNSPPLPNNTATQSAPLPGGY